jgi:ABC-type multidrug transport system fused ATPase/permease subunit
VYAEATLDAWKKGDEDDEDDDSRKGILGRLFRSKSPAPVPVLQRQSPPKNPVAAPLSDLMDRCENGKTASLLTLSDSDGCSRIGRTQAAMDMVTLAFLLIGLRQLPELDYHLVPSTLLEVATVTLPGLLHSLVSGMDTFAPFAFAAVFLSIQTRKLIYNENIGSLVKSINLSISEDAQYGALFLRLFTATTCSREIPNRLRRAAQAQISAKVDSARLTALVTFVITSMVLTTVSVIRPLLVTLLKLFGEIVLLDQWRSWPPQWKDLAEGISSAAVSFGTSSTSLVMDEVSHVSENPMILCYGLSVAASLVGVAYLSSGGTTVVVAAAADTDTEDDEDDERQQHLKLTEQVSNLGVSSSSRLNLLSDNGGIDVALERWRQMTPRDEEVGRGPSLSSFMELVFRGILSGILLVLPLAMYGYVGFSDVTASTSPIPRWDSPFDVAILLMFLQGMAWKTLSSASIANGFKQGVIGFLSSLASAIEERSRLVNAPPPNLQWHAAVSSAAGVVVKDLWAAHTTKKAWAVRGANLSCRNGEILVVLGDDAAGKSRLMTTLAEAMCGPPRRALTTTRVRGSISIGGLDVAKWDNRQLQKRVGVILHDVRTLSDFAQILSSLTLDEILDPSGGVRNLDLSHNPGPSERACMMYALKITGLYSTLLPKLPSKMSTVVTANEEDVLRPSPLRPLYQMLSPAEWSKLLLARVLAQMVHDNESPTGSSELVENSLMGSLLLLDDATLFLSEVEEARLLRELRKTGAATVLTSNRWASGRFADRIVVMKDGAVVESGTHAELMNRGPQQSLYASQWHAMTTS